MLYVNIYLNINIKAFLVIKVIIKPDMMTWYVSTSCNKPKHLALVISILTLFYSSY